MWTTEQYQDQFLLKRRAPKKYMLTPNKNIKNTHREQVPCNRLEEGGKEGGPMTDEGGRTEDRDREGGGGPMTEVRGPRTEEPPAAEPPAAEPPAG